MSVHPIHPRYVSFPTHMAASTWHQRLDAAHSKEEVLDVARDFLAGYSPTEFHTLPEPCRPPDKLCLDDIGPYAFELMREQCADSDTAELVHKLAHFFSYASTRLAQISAAHQHRNDGDTEREACG